MRSFQTRSRGKLKPTIKPRRTVEQVRKTRSIVEKLKGRGGKGKVCIVRSLGGIGDVLMVTPLLRQLKKDFPACELSFAIDRRGSDPYYKMLQNCPFIDRLVDARYNNLDSYNMSEDVTTVCIRNEGKGLPVRNRINIFAGAVGYSKLDDYLPFYKVEPEESEWARQILAPYRGQKLMVLHSASFDNQRCWWPKNYLDLLGILEKERPDIRVLVLDFNKVLGDLTSYSNVLDFSNTDVRQMAAIISESNFFLGPDSGPMHLAAALKIPSSVIFGSIPARARLNHYPTHNAITLEGLACLGCWYQKCGIDFKCMKDLTGLMVYNKIKELI